jgi:hypothetical protein
MALNLTQRRTLQSFEQKQFADWKAELTKVLGFDVPVETKWDGLFQGADNMSDDTIIECWTENYLTVSVGAFKGIVADDMGRQAIKDGLKKIILDSETDTTNTSNSTFKDGVFHLKHKSLSYSDSVATRIKAFQAIIEKGL